MPASPVLEAALFDMDGTLLDTDPIWFAAEAAYASAYGQTWTAAQAKRVVGRPLVDTAKALITLTGSADDPQKVMDYLNDYLASELFFRPLPWRPGAPQLLSALREARIPRALVTSSHRTLTDAAASQMEERTLQSVVSADDVTSLKPHPEPYLRAAANLKVNITKCVVLEDSPSGIEAAVASGANVVGIPSVVPLSPDPRISRVPSLEVLDLELLEQIAAGKKVDLADFQ